MESNDSTTTLHTESRQDSLSKLSAKEQYQADFKRIMRETDQMEAEFWDMIGAKGKAKAQDKKDQ